MATPVQSPGTALPPPPGQLPDLVDPPTMNVATIATVVVCFFMTTVPVTLRTYVRIRLRRSFQLEDMGCLLSWIGLVVYLALTLVAMSNHAGTHEWDLLKSEVPNALYWLNANSTTYGVAIMCTKISILLLYQRIFFTIRCSRADFLIKGFIALLAGFYISTTLAKIWQCLPRDHIWDKSIPGECINISALFNISGIFNTATDFVILLIPVKVVWALHLKRTRKLAVLAVFAVGSIIVGLVVRFRVSASPDLTYNQMQISLWAGAEVSTGLICVCLPELPALWSRRRNRSRSYQSGSGPVPSIGSGTPRNTTTRTNGDGVMGKRDLEYGQLLDDDSDVTMGHVLEMHSRPSASGHGESDKDVALPAAGCSLPATPEPAVTTDRGRFGDNRILKTVSMEVSSYNHQNSTKRSSGSV